MNYIVATKIKQKESVENPSVKGTLFQLQEEFSKILDEIDRSYKLYKVGEKTKLTEAIEATLANPLKQAYSISLDIDGNIKNIIDVIVKNFFIRNNSVVESVYRTKTPNQDLHYCIVLKNDTPENRTKVFGFFNAYDSTEVSEKFPVYFQFVPSKLIQKIFIQEKLKLE